MSRVVKQTRQALLEFMGGPGYRPATALDLVRLLRIDRSGRHEFKRILRQLLNEDVVVKIGGNRYALREWATSRAATRQAGAGPRHGGRHDGPHGARHQAARSRGRGQTIVSGTIQRHPRGFGFVTRDAGGPDIFVPPRGVGDLVDGDRVAVRIVRDDGKGRAEGEVVRLLEKSRKRVLGLFRARGPEGRAGTVQAYDRLFESDIVVPEEHAGKAADGMVVGVEVLRPPMERRPATGKVVEVLGRPDEPGMDLKTII